MPYVKVDVRTPRDPRFIAAGRPAASLWLELTCYAGEFLTDGLIPPNAIDATDWPLLESLIENGLVKRSGKGFLIVDYLHLNTPLATVEAKRKGTAKRVKKCRHKHLQDVTLLHPPLQTALPSSIEVQKYRSTEPVRTYSDTEEDARDAYYQRVLKAGV
mgnify:CR=1 FL=1